MTHDGQFRILDPDEEENEDEDYEPDATLYEPVENIRSAVDNQFPDPFDDPFADDDDDDDDDDDSDEQEDSAARNYLSNDPILKIAANPMIVSAIFFSFFVLFLLAVFIDRIGAVFGFLTVLVVASGIGRVLFRVKRIWLKITIQTVLSVLFFGGCILILYPIWGWSRDGFCEGLLAINDFLAGRLSESSYGLQQMQNAVQSISDGIKNSLSWTIGQRLLLLLQFICFIVIVNFTYPILTAIASSFSRTDENEEVGVIHQIAGLLMHALYRIGQFSFMRLLKAAILTIICLVGYKIAGIDGVLFIAVSVGLITLVSTLGPILAGILALTQLADASQTVYSLIVIAITTVVLSVIEAKLYLILKYFPGINKLKLPEEVFMDKEYSGAALLRWMPRIVSILLFVGLMCFAWLFYESYNSYQAYQIAAKDPQVHYNDENYQKAKDGYLRLLGKFPNHKSNCLRLIECYMALNDFESALEQAEVYATWDAESSLTDRIKNRCISLYSGASMNELTGYRMVMKQAEDADTFENLSILLKEAEADQELVVEAEAKSLYFLQKYPDCLQRIEIGLKADSSNRELLKLQAKAYFEMANYKAALQSCDKYIKISPGFDDSEVNDIRTMVLNELSPPSDKPKKNE